MNLNRLQIEAFKDPMIICKPLSDRNLISEMPWRLGLTFNY